MKRTLSNIETAVEVATNTNIETAWVQAVSADTTRDVTPELWAGLRQRGQIMASVSAAMEVFSQASGASHNVVRLLPDYSYLPVLLGSDNRPVLLYQVVEAIDGTLDYSAIQADFPTLSFSQIAGALGFLRKVAQFNLAGVDIDDLEEEHIEGNADFRGQVAATLRSGTQGRVLDSE
ncbi:MAG: hypothetical protein HY329_24030 [Chloroflexi bacterium]|nr:hypothetical protein [Chloroflexota bacterium]